MEEEQISVLRLPGATRSFLQCSVPRDDDLFVQNLRHWSFYSVLYHFGNPLQTWKSISQALRASMLPRKARQRQSVFSYKRAVVKENV